MSFEIKQRMTTQRFATTGKLSPPKTGKSKEGSDIVGFYE